MRTLVLSTVLVTLTFFAAHSTPAVAQLPYGINATKYKVAVVDIGYIFKKYERFQASRAEMIKAGETAELEMKAEVTKIQQKEEQRNGYNIGSTEYKQLDDEITRMKADLNVKVTRARKDFVEREAKMFYQAHLEVVDAVKYYAERHDISMVLRFNGEPPDLNRREQVLNSIQQTVVFQNQVDITGDILQILNREQTARPAGAGSQIPPR